MRKTFTLLLFAFFTVNAWGQSVLFERGFDELDPPGVYNDPGVYHNNCLVNIPVFGGWTAMGWQESCKVVSIVAVDHEGRIANNISPAIGESSEILSTTKGYPVYVCGYNKVAHDYPDPYAHGFIYRIGSSEIFRQLVISNDYSDGYRDIDEKVGRILVLGSKADEWGIPMGDAVAEYDTSGSLVQEHAIDPNGLALRLLGDRTIVFYANSTLVLDADLEPDNAAFPMVQSYKDALEERDEKLIVLLQNGLIEVDSSLNLTRTKVLNSSFSNTQAIARSENGHLAIFGQHNGLGKVLVLSPTLGLVDSFIIDLPCAEVVDIALNDSVIAITGNEEPNGLQRGFIKTYTYSGITNDLYDDLVITNAELVVDSIVPPSNTNVYYNINWHVDHTVLNSGQDTVKAFSILTDSYGGTYCITFLTAERYTNISIPPGASMSFSGLASTQWESSFDTLSLQLELAIRNVNHGIYNNACPQPYVLQKTIVGLHNKTLPETNIKIYPNPSTGIYHIGDASVGSTIMVQDLQGRVVLTAQVHDKTTIDLSAQPQGMYLYTVIDTYGRSVAAGKLIKQ